MEDNTADLSVLTAWWLRLTDNWPAETDCLDADIDGSGAIDQGDFAALAAQWLRPL
jgi:hypothetical protein